MINLKSVTCDMDEQETTITFSRKEDVAYIYTADNTVITKIQKLLNAEGSQWKLLQTYTDKDGNPTGYEFSAPKKMVSLKAKKKTVKEMSPEQKAAFVARLRGSGSTLDADEDADEDDE